VHGEVDGGCRGRPREARHRRWPPRVGEHREGGRLERLGLGEAQPAAAGRLVRAGVERRADRRAHLEVLGDGDDGHGRQALDVGGRRRRRRLTRVVEGAAEVDGEGPDRDHAQLAGVRQARADGAQRTPAALDRHVDAQLAAPGGAGNGRSANAPARGVVELGRHRAG
jgi:hypothetical protein